MSTLAKVATFGIAVGLMALLCGQMLAQGGPTGAITGTVQDPSGAVIANAAVDVVSEGTGQSVRRVATNASGSFTAPLLPVGSYTLGVSAPGFATTKFPGIEVRVTETTRVTAILKAAAKAETVTVSAEVATVDTVSAATGQALISQTITTLPLATQNFQQLLALSAGAATNVNNASTLGRGSTALTAINVNGGRDDNNNYQIEGVSASDYAFGELSYTPVPNPEAIQQFKVVTSLYDATQGRNGGGNINAVLKSGTNAFHGNLWEYFRNTVLDANDYFFNAAGLPRPVMRQNIFGGDLGGPIGRKAKLGFFYVNYQGTRQRSGQPAGTFLNTGDILPVLPTTNRGTAAYSQTLINTFFPSGLPAGVTGLDPVAVALLNAKGNQFGGGGFLIPSVPGTPGAYNGDLTLSTPGKYTDDQFVTSWDRDFRDGKDHLALRFFWSDSEIFEPFGADSLQIQTGYPPAGNNLNFPLDVPLHGRFGSISETHLFRNNLLNEFRFGVNVIGDSFHNQNPVTAAQLGITQPSGTTVPYRFQFGAYAIGGYPTSTQTALSDAFVWSDIVSWTRGPHVLKFGGEIDRTTIRRNLPVLDNGLLFFVSGANPVLPGNPVLTDFQDFLLGMPEFGEEGGGAGNHDYRIPAFSVFAQDDYRVTKTLTLNLGLRTEFIGAPYDTLCHVGNVNPALTSTGQPYVYPSCVSQFNIPGFTGSLNSAALSNEYARVLEPRIGFAYDLFGHHTTTIRSGYGIYGVREDLGAVDNLSFTAPVFPVAVPFLPGPGSLSCLFFTGQSCSNSPSVPRLGQLNGNFLPTTSLFQGFVNNVTGLPTNDTTQTAVFSGNIQGLIGLQVPLHWIVPTTQQWNLTVQHDFGRNWFLEVGYVGTKGTHLRATYDPDEGVLASSSNPVTITAQNGTKYVITQNTASNLAARAPLQPLAPTAYEAFAPVSDSHYNGLQVTVAHHFSKGLYLQSAYTFSKSIDDVSTASVAFLTRFNNQTDPLDSRGLSDFDRRHRSVTSFVYDLPFFKHSSGFVKGALSGWETSGVLTLQSGTPFTIMDSSGGTSVGPASPGTITADFAPGFSCANALNSGTLQQRIANWVNPNAFEPVPAVGPDGSTGFGNTPRNCLIGPPQKNMDFTVGKKFSLTERQSLRFTADFFNLTNHPSFAIPSLVDIESPKSVGEITQMAGNPRMIQFSLKYSF